MTLGTLWSQHPRIVAKATFGPTIVNIPGWDEYATIESRLKFSSTLGLGVDFPMSSHLNAGIGIGLENNGFQTNFLSSRTPRHVEAKLNLGWTYISPGVTLRLGRRLSIRGGFNILVSTFAFGEFTIWYVDHDLNGVVTETHDRHFQDIRRPISLGPEAQIGIDVVKGDFGSVVLLTEGFWGLSSFLRRDFDSPIDLKMSRISLGLGYRWSEKEDE